MRKTVLILGLLSLAAPAFAVGIEPLAPINERAQLAHHDVQIPADCMSQPVDELDTARADARFEERTMASKITTALVPLESQIAPQSVAAAGTATSGWVDAGACDNILTVVNGGALGGGSVALTWEQATDASGTGAKALSTFTGGSLTGDNQQVEVDNKPEDLDIDNSFTHVRATLTVTGGTGALVAATIQGASPRYA